MILAHARGILGALSIIGAFQTFLALGDFFRNIVDIWKNISFSTVMLFFEKFINLIPTDMHVFFKSYIVIGAIFVFPYCKYIYSISALQRAQYPQKEYVSMKVEMIIKFIFSTIICIFFWPYILVKIVPVYFAYPSVRQEHIMLSGSDAEVNRDSTNPFDFEYLVYKNGAEIFSNMLLMIFYLFVVLIINAAIA